MTMLARILTFCHANHFFRSINRTVADSYLGKFSSSKFTNLLNKFQILPSGLPTAHRSYIFCLTDGLADGFMFESLSSLTSRFLCLLCWRSICNGDHPSFFWPYSLCNSWDAMWANLLDPFERALTPPEARILYAPLFGLWNMLCHKS